MSNQTARMSHAERVGLIAQLTGDYCSKYSFKDSLEWLEVYEGYVMEGYDQHTAVNYAKDYCYYQRSIRTSKQVYGRGV